MEIFIMTAVHQDPASAVRRFIYEEFVLGTCCSWRAHEENGTLIVSIDEEEVRGAIERHSAARGLSDGERREIEDWHSGLYEMSDAPYLQIAV